jgi:hypothetical protein
MKFFRSSFIVSVFVLSFCLTGCQSTADKPESHSSSESGSLVPAMRGPDSAPNVSPPTVAPPDTHALDQKQPQAVTETVETRYQLDTQQRS